MSVERDGGGGLVDLWTTSSEYRWQFQGEEEVGTVLGLLELNRATGLVDVGCGNGAFALAAAGAYPACRVWAFDALESAAEACREGAAGLGERFAVGVARAERLPLADGAVDRLLCRSVLHHVADARSVYGEMGRVLRPGGLAVLQAPCNWWEGSFGAVIGETYRMMDDSHRRYYYRPAEIIAGLNDMGIGLRSAECWRFEFPYLDGRQAQFVRTVGAAERLKLRDVGEGRWSVELYWVRVVGKRY